MGKCIFVNRAWYVPVFFSFCSVIERQSVHSCFQTIIFCFVFHLIKIYVWHGHAIVARYIEIFTIYFLYIVLGGMVLCVLGICILMSWYLIFVLWAILLHTIFDTYFFDFMNTNETYQANPTNIKMNRNQITYKRANGQ